MRGGWASVDAWSKPWRCAVDGEALKGVLMWCAVLNGGLLIFSSLLCTFARDWIYGVHSRWFPMSRQAFDVAIYGLLGFYKVLFITLNLVPYLALVIVLD